MTKRIGVIGCTGRMGKALLHEITTHEASVLSGGVTHVKSLLYGYDLGVIAGLKPSGNQANEYMESLIEASDCVIDFSSVEGSLMAAKYAAQCNTPIVIGTTGFDDKQYGLLEHYARQCPLLWSANMSVGVNVLKKLTETLGNLLNDDFDIDIVEMHHRHKKDAPSGTALVLAEAAAEGRGVALNDVVCKSRDGMIGERPRGEIGMATLRGGDVVGEHTVIFAADGERIELSHKVSDRAIFARGALRAALWLCDRDTGFYSMDDVIGL